MDLSRVILQLKNNCPELGKRVAGAAELARASQQGYLAVPAAYVVPLADDAGDNTSLNGLWQTVTESVGVLLVLDSTADRRGQAAAASVEAMKYAVHRALLNWRADPDHAAKGLRYDGSALMDAETDAARLVWQMVYSHDLTLTEADGWQEPGEPLVEITSHGPGDGDDELWRTTATPPQA